MWGRLDKGSRDHACRGLLAFLPLPTASLRGCLHGSEGQLDQQPRGLGPGLAPCTRQAT